MDPSFDWTAIRPQAWVVLATALILIGVGLRNARRLGPPWRGVVRGLALYGFLRVLVLDNPWVWQVYSKTLDASEVGWRQADVIRHHRDDYLVQPATARYLAVGSSQTGRIYADYARQDDALDVYILAAMTPLDMVLHEERIARRRPECVLLYVSDFEIARETPRAALVTAPRQGLSLLRLWWTTRSLPMGSHYDGPMAELLVGEVFPEAKYGFVVRGVADRAMQRVAARFGQPDQPPRRATLEERIRWLREPYDERFVTLNLHFLREFVIGLLSRGIEVAIVEGRYNPLVESAQTRALAADVREALQAMARDLPGLSYFVSDEILPLAAGDFEDLTHVTEEVGQRLARHVLARLEHRPELADYNPAATPIDRPIPWWRERVRQLQAQVVEHSRSRLVFVGDSIVEGFASEGREVWDRAYRAFEPINLGISSDRTEHVLWRLQHMDFGRLRPDAAVVLIGSNNCVRPSQTAAEIAEGVEAIVGELQRRLPGTEVVLLGILPRDASTDPVRRKVNEVNARLEDFGRAGPVYYVDAGDLFVGAQGEILTERMPDGLHPSAVGYEMLARRIAPVLDPLLRSRGNPGSGHAR